jgi:V8-like Glu-specific endopeptidase
MDTMNSRATIVRELAGLYADDDSVRRLLDFAAIPMTLVRFSNRPIDTWHSAVTEADRRGKLADLLKVVLLEQPENGVLHSALHDSSATPAGMPWPSAVPGVEKIMGTQSTLLPITFLEAGLRAANSVGRVSRQDGSHGTGFLLPDDILVTNNHVLPDHPQAAMSEVRFNYQVDTAGELAEFETVPLCPEDGFATSRESDLTVVKVPRGTNKAWGAIELIDFDVAATNRVNIIQHPGGGPKQIALYHNIVSHLDDNIIQYYTDTLPGSSGSPLFDDKWRLVGVHHAGGQLYSPAEKNWIYRNEGIVLGRLLDLVRRISHTD